ncbi:nucleoredoxin-like [Gigantopelta aegis]|uniref:nucleoredoxin-like n=1 Tax=Gigantopelta aegis TaxID=1735272 RepID=UPI001B88CDE2|nr:nucleoredoxin-like [Gigantopelta aegis]
MASRMENLLGENVIRNNGEKFSVKSLCGKDKIVGIYFSANWCPPCRNFTPKLTDFYKQIKKSEKGSSFEIVFVSWDKDDASFREHLKTMPWLAVPYSDRERKDKLTKKFRVQGIPKFVLLDGETGKVITIDGFLHLCEDENGLEFPWRTKPLHDIIKGTLLHGKEEVDATTALRGKIVGLYFSAHWCPPCRHFTPELCRTYEKLKEEGRNFEVVFISSDRSKESFLQYYSSMPWLALPFDDARTRSLTRQFGIDGIPTLVMADEKGNVITVNGRAALLYDRDATEFPWYPKPLNELTQNAAMQLNESVCLVMFTEGEDDEIERAVEILTDVATREHQKGDEQELFFFYGGDDELCDQVRDFAKLEEISPLLVILDLPDQQVFVCEETDITKDVATNFVDNYLAGKLSPRSLRPNKAT